MNRLALKSLLGMATMFYSCQNAYARQLPVAYPPLAAQARSHGSAAAVLVIRPSGEIESCSISRSSGSAELDRATCALATKDRKYPAVDPPDRSHDDNDDAWTITLARIPRGLTSAVISLRYLVDQEGHLLKCETDRSSGVASLDKAACDVTAGIRFERVLDESGKSVPTVQTHHVRVTLAPDVHVPDNGSATTGAR